MALSFAKKGDITIHFNNTNRYDEMIELQEKSWQGYIDGTISFIVKDKSGCIVGVCINKEYQYDPFETCACLPSNGLTADITALSNFLFNQIV